MGLMHIRPSIIPAFLREALVMLLVAAFLFRALMPEGFMPAFTPQGGMRVVVCSGAESVPVTLDATGKPAAPGHAAKHAAPCGFTLNAGGVIPAPAFTLLALVALVAAPVLPWPLSTLPDRPARPFPSRAPPLN